MTFKEAAAETAITAKESDRLCYLYRNNTGYFVSFQYWKDWLFMAYPGGRKILSRAGMNMAVREQEDQ